jgi:siroheme synthase-like protein
MAERTPVPEPAGRGVAARFDPSPFPVALVLAGRAVLVLGGDEEAADKVPRLLAAGAQVTVVAPELAPPLERLSRQGALRWFARAFAPSDVQGVRLVLLTAPDPALATQLRALQAYHPFWVCTLDHPTFSDLHLVSTLRRGPVQIAISTGGKAPLLARRLRRALEQGLDPLFVEFARKFADLRARLRTLPRALRTQRLDAALNGFAIEVRVRYPAEDPFGEVPREDPRG